jgi:hypothetical protein
VVKSRDQRAGLYGLPVTTGAVHVGDPVYLENA